MARGAGSSGSASRRGYRANVPVSTAGDTRQLQVRDKTVTTETLNVVHIAAREWFEKVNGNSYFTARAWHDGKTYTIPFQYGRNAKQIADVVRVAIRDNGGNVDGLRYVIDMTYVTRKRDLHADALHTSAVYWFDTYTGGYQ